MNNIREMDLNNSDKFIARQSILKHMDDLIDYTNNYNSLRDAQRIWSIELIQCKLRITSEIYNNAEVILR